MNDLDFNKKLLQAMEESFPMPMPGGMEKPQPEETETASYTKTKRTDKGSVTITANAESMQDLHDVLKLAGITLPKNDDQPEDPFDKDGDDVCDGCGNPVVDGSCGCDDHEHPEDGQPAPSQMDKAVITGMLRDKLKNYLRNGL
jgi:hypothetical protein